MTPPEPTESGADGTNRETTLEIRRCRHLESLKVSHFIINYGIDDLNMNTVGAHARHSASSSPQTPCIIGPLPPFAILTTRSMAIFWWDSPDQMTNIPPIALDGLPSTIGSAHESVETSKLGKRKGEPLPSEQPRKKRTPSPETPAAGTDDTPIETSKPAEKIGEPLSSKPLEKERTPSLETPAAGNDDAPAKTFKPGKKNGEPLSSGSQEKTQTPRPETPAAGTDDAPAKTSKPAEKKGEPLSSGQPEEEQTPSPEAPKTWLEKLNEGFERHELCREAKYKKQKSSKKRQPLREIQASTDMPYDDMMLAIACLWRPLWLHGIRFSLAAVPVYSPPGTDIDPEDWQLATEGERGFIMPILSHLEDEEATADEIGHFNVALARRVESKEKGTTLDVDIYDSKPRYLEKSALEERIKRIVSKSQWLEVNQWSGDQINPQWREIRTPKQIYGNTCGLFTILNAWAFMLNIDIHPKLARRTMDGYNDPRQFIKDALRIVNLALIGCMDSDTIRAFMHVHGYAAEGNGARDAKNAVPRVSTIRIDHEILTDIFKSQHKERNPAPKLDVSSKEVKEALTSIMTIANCTNHRAKEALERTETVEEAVAWLFDDRDKRDRSQSNSISPTNSLGSQKGTKGDPGPSSKSAASRKPTESGSRKDDPLTISSTSSAKSSIRNSANDGRSGSPGRGTKATGKGSKKDSQPAEKSTSKGNRKTRRKNVS